MTLYAATIGELLIICVFGLWLWIKALLASFISDDRSIAARKVRITGTGIVLVCISVGGIMIYRLYELATGFWPFVLGITLFYMVLGLGNICFIVSASIGGDKRLLKSFAAFTIIWTAYCIYAYLSGNSYF